MEGVLMVSDLAWIQRGVAKEIPDKIKLDQQELKLLIEGGVAESTDHDSSDNDEKEENAEEKQKVEGLRGSKKPEDVEMEEDDKEEDFEKTYLKDYDKDDEEEEKEGQGMRGIAMYTSNKDDPYITTHVDSDEEEEEKDELVIRKDDNMVAIAKIDKGDFTLECYVYNEADSDWYCHHDYFLDAPPLCIEPIQHDPGNDETGKGNLIAVGTMNSEIHIWDLDVMNTVTPFLTLGKAASSKSKRKKRDGSAQGHSDAVISLAWNKITCHVLASGGADKQVVLWDLDEAKPAQILANRGGEVQSIKWHPNESTFLLLGTMKGDVQVVDCRDTSGQPSAIWKFDGQIEKVLWNHFNPFTAFVSSDDGKLRHLDMRKPGECLWEGTAHDGAIGGLTISAFTKGLLVTVGEDEMLNVWKVNDSNGSIDKVHSEKLSIGELHCAQFNPDVAAVLTVGGTAADLIRVIDLTKYEPVVNAFSE